MNPGNAPLVVGQLLDDECPEDFIKGLILSVRSLLPVEPLVDECEKRFEFFVPLGLQSDKFHIPFLSESHPFEYVNQEPPTVAYSILGASSE